MSESQDRVDAAKELYAERCKLASVYYKLSLRDLKRLNELVRKLTDREMQMVAAYAEGLAEWGQPDSQSGDASSSQGSALQSGPTAT